MLNSAEHEILNARKYKTFASNWQLLFLKKRKEKRNWPLLGTVPKTKKIRGRENIAVGTWNVRTLRPAGKLEQLTHAMSRYHWNIVGLCEMRWKNFGEMSTDDGHKVYFSGEEGKHEYGVGFLVHKDVVGAVLGCQPVSSRLISIRLRAAPFNITIIQVYAPTSGHDDSEVDHFYQKLQETKHQRRTFWLYKGIGMLKLGRMHRQTGEKFVDPTAMSRQMREVSDF